MVEYYPKVLIAIPTYEGKDYIFRENFEAIKNIDYPNYEYLYIDNSVTEEYSNTLKGRGANVVRVPRGENSRQALCNAQNYARHKVLDEDYDYLMFIESDLVPDKDVLKRLINFNRPVVGSIYLIGHEIKVPCVFFLDHKKESGLLGTRLIHPMEVKHFMNTGLRLVHGLGFGCVLIRKDVVKRFPFWFDSRFDNKHSDVYFYMDLAVKGIPVFVDTDHVITHFPSKWELVNDK